MFSILEECSLFSRQNDLNAVHILILRQDNTVMFYYKLSSRDKMITRVFAATRDIASNSNTLENYLPRYVCNGLLQNMEKCTAFIILHILNFIVLQFLDEWANFVCIPIPLGIDLQLILSIVEAHNLLIL